MPTTPPISPYTGGPTLSPSLISYLESLGLGSDALAKLLDAAAGGLLGAVPPAGEYITSLDYETLYPALASQYVGEVIQQYEAQLGASPELYQAAVEAGYMTAEQAQAAQASGFSQPGSLEAQFGRQGGIRALAGPYQAQRAQIVQQAMSDMQTAAQKASTDAYTMANKSTDSRINALTSAGNIGGNLVGYGVSRRNAQDAAGGGEISLPEPPTQNDPSLWEKILPGLITTLGAGGLAYLTRPRADTGAERAQRDAEYADEKKRLDDSRKFDAAHPSLGGGKITPDDLQSEERYPGYQGVAPVAANAGASTNPYGASPPASMGAYDYPEISQPAPAAPSYSWSQPLQSSPSYSGGQDDPWQGVNYGNSGGGNYYDDPWQGYDWSGGGSTPSYSGGYDDPWQGYDYSYSAPDYSSYGDYSSGYWV